MNKSPDAFRTISEVADHLEIPAHVLRFWESRFPQIRPVKRAGGRRYYRPADVALLSGIKRLLHDEGMTIRGVQKILREQGVRFVSGVADDSAEAEDDAALAAALADAAAGFAAPAPMPAAEAESAQIIALESALREPAKQRKAPPADADLFSLIPDPSTVENKAPERAPEPAPAPLVASNASAMPPADPAPEAPAPKSVPEPVPEAPMEVWAEEQDHAPDPIRMAPVISLPRSASAAPEIAPEIAPDSVPDPLAAEPAPAPSAPASAALSAGEAAPLPSGPTLAARLRATRRVALSPQSRGLVREMRAKATALRARLAGPSRMPV